MKPYNPLASRESLMRFKSKSSITSTIIIINNKKKKKNEVTNL